MLEFAGPVCVQERHDWAQALDALDARLRDAVGEVDAWILVAECVRRVTSARTVLVSVPAATDPDRMHVMVAAGIGSEHVVGRYHSRAGSLADEVVRSGRARRSADDQGPTSATGTFSDVRALADVDPRLGSVVALPLVDEGVLRGVLLLGLSEDEWLSDSELDQAADFAGQATALLDSYQGRMQGRFFDGGAAARTLREDVLQLVQAARRSTGDLGEVPDGALRTRLQLMVDQLDQAVRQMRPVGVHHRASDASGASPGTPLGRRPVVDSRRAQAR